MTTRARLVFGLFVGLTTYGYLRLSQRVATDRWTMKLFMNSVYGKRAQRGHHYHLLHRSPDGYRERTSTGIVGTPIFGETPEPIHAD